MVRLARAAISADIHAVETSTVKSKNGGKKKGRSKKKLGIANLEGPAAERTLEDMYHEGNISLRCETDDF